VCVGIILNAQNISDVFNGSSHANIDPRNIIRVHRSISMQLVKKVFEGLPDIVNSLYEYFTCSTYYTTTLTQSFLPVNPR